MGNVFFSGDDIKLKIHPVNKKYIDNSALGIHHFGALRPAVVVGMRGLIGGPLIGFGFYYHSRDAPSVFIRHHERFPKQFAGDLERVVLGIKLFWQFHLIFKEITERQLLVTGYIDEMVR